MSEFPEPNDSSPEASTTPPGGDQENHAPQRGGTPLGQDAPMAATAEDAGAGWQDLALQELLERRAQLQKEIRDLESRRDGINREIASSFTGQADAVARRLKGFQDYLVGALQDLAVAAEQIDLVPQPVLLSPSPLDAAAASSPTQPPSAAESETAAPQSSGGGGLFAADGELIRERLAAFQGQPDFYADPWKLRRSLEASGSASLEGWFLEQGGRGAQPSSGSRNRNGLLTAAAIAILGELYGDRFQTLVLAGQPERLGEWRRSLQDCLGLSREDFGPSSGIMLFERPDALIERADRLEERGELPFIVIDAAEQVVDIPILQFPLWLAFAAGPGELAGEEEFY
jgi:hypothetical protein